MTKEDVENAIGEGEQECWFGEKEAMNRARWRVGVGEIAVREGKIQPPPFAGINPDQNWMMMMM